MVLMKSPTGSGGLGFDGEFYATDENGLVEVPEDGVEDAKTHGFELYKEEPKEKKAEAEAKEKKAKL
jgi:hypothetical protein